MHYTELVPCVTTLCKCFSSDIYPHSNTHTDTEIHTRLAVLSEIFYQVKKKKNGTLANVFYPFFWFLLFLLRTGNFRDDDYTDLDWDNLGFGIMPTDYMYLMKCSKGEDFERGQLNRYGNIELGPAAGVLNYGQVSCKRSLCYNIHIFAC